MSPDGLVIIVHHLKKELFVIQTQLMADPDSFTSVIRSEM